MKLLLILTVLFFSQTLFCQYKIDPAVKNGYLKILKTHPEEFQKMITSEYTNEYKRGLSLLYDERKDTLNKKDIEHDLNSIHIYNIDSKTGKVDSIEATVSEKEQISKEQPIPLSCNCSFKNDTLTIISGIYLFSGFTIVTNVYGNKTNAIYSEAESEGKVLQRTLNEKKTNRITIPATVNFLTLNSRPNNKTKELFGEISITTTGYYSYMNAEGFRNDYIHKRMKFQMYFRCDIKNKTE